METKENIVSIEYKIEPNIPFTEKVVDKIIFWDNVGIRYIGG
jgi:hypothetical protein